MSTLQSYLDKNGIKAAAFAAHVSISRGALHDLLTGRRKPSLPLAKRISDVTLGAVPMEAWVEEHASSHGRDDAPHKTSDANESQVSGRRAS